MAGFDNDIKKIVSAIKNNEISPEKGLQYLKSIRNGASINSKIDYYKPEWITKEVSKKSFSNAYNKIFLINNRAGFSDLNDELRRKGLIISDKYEAEAIVFIPDKNGSFNDGMKDSVYSLFSLIKDLIRSKCTDIKKFVYVYEENDSRSNLAYEAALGFISSLSLLMPNASFSSVQLDHNALGSNEVADIIYEELNAVNERKTTEIAYLEEIRKVKGLSGLKENIPVNNLYKENGVYIISGGMGALGRKYASYLSKKYNANVILFGRTYYTQSEISKLLGGLNESRVAYYSVDVCDLSSVKKIVNSVIEKYGHINGIIHIAGGGPKEVISDKSIDDFNNTIKAKIYGAFNLDEATREVKMDFFMTFSSLSAFFGDFGQCDYATGNRFLTAFSRYREEQVKNGSRYGTNICVCWPLWENGGMHGNSKAEALYKKVTGLEDISDSEGDYLFENLPVSSCLLIIKGDSAKYQKALNYLILNGAENIDGDQKRTVILDALHEMVVKIIGIKPENINNEENIANYGFESLDLKSFAEAINEKWNVGLTPTIFFEKSTISELADHLIENHIVINIDNKKKENEIKSKKNDINNYNLNRKKKYAIIGIDGVFPKCSDINDFWNRIENEENLITEIPLERWDYRKYYSEKNVPYKSNSKWGGFIPDIDKFDERFFNISPYEAEIMDPQQRLCIQSVWKAIEDAGYKASSLAGKDIGVFFGAEFSDYQNLMNLCGEVNAQVARGNAHTMISNRISFIFDFNGPSEVVDTACSASLVAIKKAVDSMALGECSMAVVGGVSLNISPYNYVAASQMGMLSKDGKCKAFDKKANGFVKSEGVGVVIIKEYEQAVKDGDNIYAAIIGSAENHGGKANSLTSPNRKMQTELIEKAYRNADIDVETVSYIETHGTGTELGDPIEIDALKDAFNKLRSGKDENRYNYCGLGAIKSNIGHLEAASGIAGFIKVLLSFKHKKLNRVLFDEQNPYIKLENTPFYIIDQTKDWENLRDNSGKMIPRRAGVSAFGFGGSNAHIVLEESINNNIIQAKNYPKVFVLSAKDETQLRVYINNYLKFAENNYSYIEENWQSVLYTLQVGREQMDARIAICADNAEELLICLKKAANDWRNTDKIFIEKDNFISNTHLDESLALEWVNGKNIDWKEYWDAYGIRRVSLPTYPFKKNSHWIKAFKDIVNNIFNVKVSETIKEAADVTIAENKLPETKKDTDLLYSHKWEKCNSSLEAKKVSGKFGVLVSNDISDALFDKLSSKSDMELFKFSLNSLGIEKAKEIISAHNDISGIIDISDLSQEHDMACKVNTIKLVFLQQLIISLRNISLIHITSNACAFKSENVTMNGVLTAGLFRMLSKEYKNIRAITVDIEDTDYESVIYGIRKGFEHIDLTQICIRKGQVYRQYFCKEIKLSNDKFPIFREKVYVIAGGTSGIGLELAESLLQQGAKKLVLMGLHDIPNILEWGNIDYKNYDVKTVSKVKKYLKLIEKGAELHFYIGEISDKEKMMNYFNRIKEKVGRIGGVIQAAWNPFSDTPFFINKSIEQIEKVIEPKTEGTVILSEIVKEEPIDFFIMCSSIASAIPEMGVGNCHYSMANYYLDCFSGYMQSRGNKAYKTINWVFWGETGAANSAENTQRLKNIGIYSMNNQEGISCFNNVLDSEGYRFMAGRLNEEMYCDIINNNKNKNEMSQLQEFHENQLFRFEKLHNIQICVDEYIALRLMKIFHKHGYFDEKEKEYNVNEMITDMSVIGKYRSLFIAMLSILQEHDDISFKNGNETVVCINNSVDENKLIELRKELRNAENEYRDIYILLKECLDNLEPIIKGQEQSTRIIFPNGSMKKVEAIYSKGEIIGHLNSLMAKYIFEVADGLLKNNGRDKVRILEVGAGTGGTSRYILKELAEKSDKIEYCYTDVSNAFLIFAKDKFKQYDFVDYKILNVNYDLASQGFDKSSFDIICATNVIHATRNINKTLKKLNILLKKDGLVLVSEMMSVQNFATCIFGLLDDWWNYEDKSVRLANSPLLSRESWEEQYRKAGFYSIDFFGIRNATNSENAQGVLCGRKVEDVADDTSNVPKVKKELSLAGNDKENNMDKNYIIEIISGFLSELLHIDRNEINSDTPLETYGIDSILVQTIISGLEEKFNFSINPALVLENKNISQMAQYMLDNYKSELDPLLPKTNNVTVFEDKKENVNTNADKNSDPVDDRKVAIIGMAGVFPGANNIDEFWENIKNGLCSIREVPENRWNIEKYYSTKMEAGKTVSKWGGFLDDITSFDAGYFNFTDDDAVHVDPLARKFLEVSAQAVNHAGYRKEELNGKCVGVFAAGRVGDYSNAVGDYRKNSIVGLGQNFIAANVSRHFNVHGPSMVIDTACSSSLVSIHEACKSIISGESQMAIAGGVEILLNARPFLILSQMGAFSPNGVCSPFDEKANGFVPGEGCGVIVMKSLKDAKKDGDKIYAVIDGSAVNCDGNTMGMTTPNPHMQKQVIIDALSQNNTDASTYSYIEAHGTGTQIGDSIELKGLTEVLREYTDEVGYCVVGSVKANIGHLFLASGVAGLIKCVLCINNKKLVPLINCDKPNPRYKFDNSPLVINRGFIDWEPKCGIRRAGISAFGLGGTNAHIIVSEFTDTNYYSERSPLSDIKFNKKRLWHNETTDNTNKNGTNRRMLKLIKG